MGCDIHVHLERRDERGRFVEIPQVPDEYPLGVRNWANIIPLSSPCGLPHDLSATVREQSDEWDVDGHSHSRLTLHELLSFDYDQPLLFREGGRDSRCTEATYRELLDEEFLMEVRDLQAAGVARVVFWFDN